MKITILKQGTHLNIGNQGNEDIRFVINPICSTVVLLKGEKNIIVDPGNYGFEEEILENLSKEGLKPEDIDYVINTHKDYDHILNNYLFKQKKIIQPPGVIWHDKKVDCYKSLDKIKIPEIELIDTKGHRDQHMSIVVKIDNKTYVIAGDAITYDMLEFDFRNDDEKKSAKKILDIADVIIPGHGPVIEGEDLNKFKELVK